MFGRNAPALLISTVVHIALLGAMALYRISLSEDQPEVAVETVIADERAQQEFEQDLSMDTDVSDNLSVQSGGMVTTALGADAAQPVEQVKIEKSEALQDPDVKVTTISDISLPGVGELGVDLGEGEVSGEVGARVEGYGAAMHRITQELTRMMRQQPVLVVWLFDSSESMKDDREEIAKNFHKIYEELNIAKEEAKRRNQRFSALETQIVAFGKDSKKLLPQPTDDLEAIRKAINNVPHDPSGIENTFTAISKVIDEYGTGTARTKRKLAIVVVTDEAGLDDGMVEDTIVKAERFKSPIYFIGREAVFGYPYARVRWRDPEPPNLTHWIRIVRGPETAFAEALQYDGFRGRYDSASSGFGPWGQVRVSKKSGGIFFFLASDEADLVGRDATGPRKFEDLAMKEYVPLLLSRREYEQERNKSEFRRTIWQVIVALNPHEGYDPELSLRVWHYPMDPQDFAQEAKRQFDRSVRAMGKMNEGIKILERIKPMRAKEASSRWRGAYDLAYAQLLSYRVRQFQFLLALDKHVKEKPKPKDPKHNEWNVRNTKKMLPPDEQQVKATKIDMEELEKQRQKAIEAYEFVMKEHPGTPWARRAEQELGWGFGITFESRFRDPRYDDPKYRDRVPDRI
jgi:hypothetical protein